MKTLGVVSPKIALYGLDSSLSRELSLALLGLQLSAESLVGPGCGADLVFCPADEPALRRALATYNGTPVVVVSRLPEVQAWLNALEAGAADYCGAPFEAAQLRWLLATHLPDHPSLKPVQQSIAARAAA